MPRVFACLAVALVLGGCVYYNSMYNTKRLANSARKAERDGRAFEATNLWGQVVVRAETLITRHPDSKYVDEALVLKGLALSRLRQCQVAVAPLGHVSLLPEDSEVATEATLALGRCQLELGDPALAELMFAKVSESDDPVLRREARLLRGRALRLSGRPGEAIASLHGLDDPRAGTERLLSLAAIHRRDDALALADSLLAIRDTTVQWDTMPAALGRADPLIASGLVDRLVARPQMVPQMRAVMLLDDGLRLEGVDSARSRARLEHTAALKQAGDFPDRARYALTRQHLGRTASVAELRTVHAELVQHANARSGMSPEAAQLRDQVVRVLVAADSAVPGAPQGDLRLFLAAEAARDSLGAPRLAASLFRTLVETMPDSPYAPKALLAGKSLDPVWGESVTPLLTERYAFSPYVAMLRGEEPYGYQELEDSLEGFARTLAPAAVPGARGRADSLPTRPGQAPPRRGGLIP
ncbi:MAG TPA: hypothetical protein VH700_06730 [Gemmatimonadales bacterium]|jgi:hypothetical protein